MLGNVPLYLVFSVMGFFLGSIMFSLILPQHFKGVDVRRMSDDGNPGTANAVKYGGIVLGMFCLLGDLLKAGLPVYLARRYCGAQSPLFALVMASPVIGHAFSPFLGGKGGKAIAPAFGVLAALYPQDSSVSVLAIAFIFFSLIVIITPDRIKAIVAFLVLLLYSLFFNPNEFIALGSILLSIVVIIKHLRPLPEEVAGISFLHKRKQTL